MDIINAIYIGAFIITGLLACIGLAWSVALKSAFHGERDLVFPSCHFLAFALWILVKP